VQVIECESIYGYKKLIPKDKLFFRPSAYGILVNDGKILLVKTRSTGKYFFPGGAVELGERIEEALKREVIEETGLEIEIEHLFHFKEVFFYYDPTDEAFHGFAFSFVCKLRTFDLIDDNLVDDIEAEKPRWYELQSLKAEDFQSFAGEIFQLLQRTA
jgi:nucleoside triphosphatase